MSLFLCLLFVSSACTSKMKYRDTSVNIDLSDSSRLAKSAFDSFQPYLEEKQIVSIGNGVIENKKGKIESFYQAGVCQRNLDIRMARSFFIEVSKELLKRINENKKLQKGLVFHPVSPKKIYFSLSFMDSKGDYISDGLHIAKIILQDGFVRYYVYDTGEKKHYRTYDPRIKSQYYDQRDGEERRLENLVLLDEEWFKDASILSERLDRFLVDEFNIKEGVDHQKFEKEISR